MKGCDKHAIRGKVSTREKASSLLVTIANMDVNDRVAEIVAEVTQVHQQWAGYELILSILMDRYSIGRFEELGVGPPLGIPSLKLIHDLNQRLKVFLYAYCSEGIITYLDLERDIGVMLRTFSFPSISGTQAAKAVIALDPNEIAVEETESEGNANGTCTENPPGMGIGTYGLGPLHKHPFVQEMFPVPLQRERLKDGKEVFGLLSDFLASGKQGKVEAFSAYLSHNAWASGSYKSLAEAGVHIRSLDSTEVLACRHARSAHSREKILEGNAVETAIGLKRASMEDAGKAKKKRRQKRSEEGDKGDEREEASACAGSSGPVDISTLSTYEMVPTALLQPLCSALPSTKGKEGAAAAGRWGEALAYQHLLRAHPSARVTWVNEEEETMSPYDLIIEQEVKQGPEGPTKTKTTFVEVKSTRYPGRHAFNISLNEWAFCTAEPALRYDVYRVYNAGNPEAVSISILQDLHELVKQQQVQLQLRL